MNPLQEHAAVTALNKVTYGAAGSALYFGVTANELAALGGLAIAVIALVVSTAINIYFKSQHLKLAREHFHPKESADE